MPVRSVLRNPLRSALRTGIGEGVGYGAEASSLFARFTTPPTDARKAQINALIQSLKAGGVWPKLDALYLMAAADNQAARRNWIADQYNQTAVNSPTFAADRGYTGDDTSAYLTTGAVLNALSKYAQDNALMGVFVRTVDTTNNEIYMGAQDATVFCQINVGGASGDTTYGRLNNANANLVANTAPANVAGSLHVVDRSGASTLNWYINGTLATTAVQASNGVPAFAPFILGSNNSGSISAAVAAQISAAFIGQSLTAGEQLALYNAILTYLQAVGAA